MPIAGASSLQILKFRTSSASRAATQRSLYYFISEACSTITRQNEQDNSEAARPISLFLVARWRLMCQ